MRRKSFAYATFLIIIDQIIKIIINNSFSYTHLPIIDNFFYLANLHNHGAAWSLFAGSRYFLIIIAICSFGILYSYEKCFQFKMRTLIGFSLVYGGLIGNLIDRIVHGYVIDYIELIFGSYHFPVFNIADICLVSGFCLIMIALIKKEDKYDLKMHEKRY